MQKGILSLQIFFLLTLCMFESCMGHHHTFFPPPPPGERIRPGAGEIKLASAVKQLLTGIEMKLAGEEEKITVAVVPFSGPSRKCPFGSYIADNISTELTKYPHNISVLERARVDKILKEQQFTLTPVVDESTAPEIGKLLGVKVIIMGSYYQVGDRVEVLAKAVSVSTGEILSGIKMQLKKNFVEEMGCSLKREKSTRRMEKVLLTLGTTPVRRCPAVSCPVVITLPPRMQVIFLKRKGRWVKVFVRSTKTTGWVKIKHLIIPAGR